jgi:hypothetical protein
MINFLKAVWDRVSDVIFPDDYYAWQTFIYLGIFSFVMSWIAVLAAGAEITISFIATAGWSFFALGIGWLLEKKKVTLFGLSLAPWVVGAIICTYFYGLFPWLELPATLIGWPLVSVAVAAVPQFFTWELRPKTPSILVRRRLILLLLIAFLFSNWFNFYFRIQSWFEDYPSLVADDFSNSGFVVRMSSDSDEQARGVVLLTSAEGEVKKSLNDTPWPYVERWLLSLDEKLEGLEDRSANALDRSMEQDLWQLQASPRRLDNSSYALDLMAVWSGPASNQNGYYLEKTCVIHPRSQPLPTTEENGRPTEPIVKAEVECDLATPKHVGKPPSSI